MTTLLNILLLVAVALSITGVVNRTRARLAGRRGPRFTQHLHNTALLLRKGAVYSTTTSALFRTAPALYLAAAVTALLFIPVGDLPPVVSFPGDLVCFIYLLALSRAALILAAMDTGSSFEGMGASREALYGALVEPALLLTTATLALMTGHTSFAAIFSAATPVEVRFTIILLLLGYLLTKIFIVEQGRIPVDDPRTHLELTMIHEVMCLDYGGIDLAFIQIAGWLKGAALAVLAWRHAAAGRRAALVVGRTAGRAAAGPGRRRRRIDAGAQQTLAQRNLSAHHRRTRRADLLHGDAAAPQYRYPMILALVLLYVVSLVYISITERFRSYASLVGLQGWLLLAIALVRLQQIEIWSLLFVVAETLLFKAIVVPAILFAVIRRTKINRIAASGTSQFNSLVLSLAALVASISVTYCIAEETINLVFFGVALYALLSGLILIVVRTRIFSHMVGFLVIENGVFLFSMAVGVEMPSMIEIAIMLDILISILMLGLFLTKIGARFRIGDTDLLTNVKD